jgi:hypothetical protein
MMKSGLAPMATSAHRSVGVSARAARIAPRVRGRHAFDSSPSGSESAQPVRLGARASSDGSRASGSRGRAAVRGNRWLPKRGEGRSRPEPNLPAMPSWGRVRAQRRGGGAGSERRTLPGPCGIEFFSDSGRRQGESEQGAAEAGNGGGDDAAGSVSDERHRLESLCGRARHLAPRELESSGGRRRFAFGVSQLGSAIAGGETIGLHLEVTLDPAANRNCQPGLPERAGEGSCGARQLSGDRQLEHRACGGTQRISTVFSRRLCRDGGGNTAAPFSMWLFGSVQSALALFSDGRGDSSPSPPGGAGGREERALASFEGRRFQPAGSASVEHAGSLLAWRHAGSTERHAGTRQGSAAAHEKAEGAEGISHEIAEADSPETF